VSISKLFPFLTPAGLGEYAEAATAYEAAGDQDSVVRLNLDKLKSPHKAAVMVRRGGSREGAQRLAQYCIAARDYQVSQTLCLQARTPDLSFGTNDSLP